MLFLPLDSLVLLTFSSFEERGNSTASQPSFRHVAFGQHRFSFVQAVLPPCGSVFPAAVAAEYAARGHGVLSDSVPVLEIRRSESLARCKTRILAAKCGSARLRPKNHRFHRRHKNHRAVLVTAGICRNRFLPDRFRNPDAGSVYPISAHDAVAPQHQQAVTG